MHIRRISNTAKGRLLPFGTVPSGGRWAHYTARGFRLGRVQQSNWPNKLMLEYISPCLFALIQPWWKLWPI